MGKSGHYIPKFYLKGFTDTETPKNQEPYCWVYEFKSRIWKKRAPVNVASKKDFYIYIDEEYKRDEKVEEALAVLEGNVATIFRNKIQNMESLNFKERAIIAEFIASMMTRTAKFHNEVDSFISEIAKFEMIRLHKASADDLRKVKENIEKETQEKLPDDFDASYFDPSQYRIKATKSFLLGMMLRPIREATTIMYRMTWTFLHTKDNSHFITSDSPCVILNPKSSSADRELLHKDIKVSLPFSSQICLLAHWGTTAQQHKVISGDANDLKIVEVFNRVRIKEADKYIFSCKNEFIGDKYLV